MLTVDLVTVRTALEAKELTGQNFSANQYWLRGSRHDPFRQNPADTDVHEVDDWEANLCDEADENPYSKFQRPKIPEPATSPGRSQQRTVPFFDDD
jgi:hypothetical protein